MNIYLRIAFIHIIFQCNLHRNISKMALYLKSMTLIALQTYYCIYFHILKIYSYFHIFFKFKHPIDDYNSIFTYITNLIYKKTGV